MKTVLNVVDFTTTSRVAKNDRMHTKGSLYNLIIA